MTTDPQVDELVRDLGLEAYEDYVGLWIVAKSLREMFPTASDTEVQAMGAEVVRRLVEDGVELGDAGNRGEFTPWDDPTDVDAAMQSWLALGRDPNIGDPVALMRP